MCEGKWYDRKNKNQRRKERRHFENERVEYTQNSGAKSTAMEHGEIRLATRKKGEMKKMRDLTTITTTTKHGSCSRFNNTTNANSSYTGETRQPYNTGKRVEEKVCHMPTR